MRRRGVEDAKAKTPVIAPAKQPRRKLSKAELREQAAAAFLAWRAGQTSKDKWRGAKRLGSIYRSGRSPLWLKVKNPKAPAVRREAEEDWGR